MEEVVMGFVKSYEELGKMSRETYDFYDAQMLTMVWETKPEIVKRLLPPPLKSAKRPLAMAFVAYYPKTNFGPAYHEGALFVRADFEGVEGNYCLATCYGLANWRKEYNQFRLHSSLRYKPPAPEAKMLVTLSPQGVPFPGADHMAHRICGSNNAGKYVWPCVV
jgi:hypothetical protein